MAARTDESVRRVRARIEKEGLGDALATQILERKALDHILEFVEIEDVPLDEAETAVETLDQTATHRPCSGCPGVGCPGAVSALRDTLPGRPGTDRSRPVWLR